ERMSIFDGKVVLLCLAEPNERGDSIIPPRLGLLGEFAHARLAAIVRAAVAAFAFGMAGDLGRPLGLGEGGLLGVSDRLLQLIMAVRQFLQSLPTAILGRIIFR